MGFLCTFITLIDMTEIIVVKCDNTFLIKYIFKALNMYNAQGILLLNANFCPWGL